MDPNERFKLELKCLNDMFNERLDEDVVYIIYKENCEDIEKTIGQLLAVSQTAITGYNFTSDELRATEQHSEDLLIDAQTSISSNSDESSSSSTTAPSRHKQQNNQASKKNAWTTVTRNKRKNNNAKKPPSSSNNTSPVPESVECEDDHYLNNLGFESPDETVKALQARMAAILEEKIGDRDKARFYHCKKMFPVASFYADKVVQLNKNLELITQQLVDLMMKRSENSNSLDLHGLNLHQSCILVTRWLDERKQKLITDKQDETYLDIITGWGKHSVDCGRIKANVIAMLQAQGLVFHQLNKGALRVMIRSRY